MLMDDDKTICILTTSSLWTTIRFQNRYRFLLYAYTDIAKHGILPKVLVYMIKKSKHNY